MAVRGNLVASQTSRLPRPSGPGRELGATEGCLRVDELRVAEDDVSHDTLAGSLR